MIVLPVPCLISPPVLTELQLAGVIASEECKRLSDIRGVVSVQGSKSSDVLSKTAHILRRFEFEAESKLFAGRQSRPSSICLFYVVQCMEPPYYGHLGHPLLSTDRCP